MGAVWGERPDGPHFWRIAEEALLACGFSDDQWIGWRDGSFAAVSAVSERWRAVEGKAVDTVLYDGGLVIRLSKK